MAKERVTLRRLEQLLVDAAELLGKMDVAAKRNYVFALLLLKRCSDAFDEARERVYAAELTRTGSEQEAAEIADDPDEYTTHVFVPEVSGWAGLATVHRLGILRRVRRHRDPVVGDPDLGCSPGLSGRVPAFPTLESSAEFAVEGRG